MASKRITVVVENDKIFFFTKEDARKLLKPLKKLGIHGEKKTVYCG
ncbi:MAG: hypothetical protein QXU09_03820 [Thermoproteota archaeon]